MQTDINTLKTASTAHTNDIAGVQSDINALELIVGLNTDEETSESLKGRTYSLTRHIHSAQKVYPTLAAGVTLTGGAGAWELGAKTEIVPISTITAPFDIHYINPGAASATDTYELVLYKGAEGAEIEIGRCRIVRAAAQSGTAPTPMMTELLLSNARISAAIATSGGGSDTIAISIFYHTY
jgi:hypothetical protein